jgi:hypothetical protein
MIMGTPNYMSPEQVRGEKATARSDVFSLGAVFYELLTNRKPFEADSLHAVLFQVMQNEPETLANLIPDIPLALQQVVERAMAKDPNVRFRDAGEMREALRPARAAMVQWAGTMPPTEVDATIVGAFDPNMAMPSIASRTPIPAPGSRPPAPIHPPTPLPTTDGAVALEARSRTPAETVTPRQPGTLSGRASTQVPAGAPGPPTPIPTAPPPVHAKSHPPAPAPIVHPPTPIPSRSHPPAPVVYHPPTPLPTVPLPAPPPVVRQPPPPPSQPVARQVRLPAPQAPVTPPPMPRQTPPEASRPVEPPRPGEGGGGAWKAPVFVGGAVVVVLLAAGIYVITRPVPPKPSPSPTDVTQPPVDPATAEHLQKAKDALGAKDYKRAADEANAVLQADAQNAEARPILDQAQAALKRIDATVASLQKALAGKDNTAASRELDELMKIAPSHPEIDRARTALQAVYKDKATQAKTEMAKAQREATQARATTQAEFKQAVTTGLEADALAAKGEFVNATQKYMQAGDLFARAREAQRQTVPTPVAPTPVPQTTTTTTTPHATPVPTPVPTPAAVNEEPAIRRVIADFDRAFETGDVALWKQIRSGAADSEIKAVAQKNWKQVNITIESIDILQTRAIVRITRNDLGVDGKSYKLTQTLTLQKEASGWKITSLGR